MTVKEPATRGGNVWGMATQRESQMKLVGARPVDPHLDRSEEGGPPDPVAHHQNDVTATTHALQQEAGAEKVRRLLTSHWLLFLIIIAPMLGLLESTSSQPVPTVSACTLTETQLSLCIQEYLLLRIMLPRFIRISSTLHHRYR